MHLTNETRGKGAKVALLPGRWVRNESAQFRSAIGLTVEKDFQEWRGGLVFVIQRRPSITFCVCVRNGHNVIIKACACVHGVARTVRVLKGRGPPLLNHVTLLHPRAPRARAPPRPGPSPARPRPAPAPALVLSRVPARTLANPIARRPNMSESHSETRVLEHPFSPPFRQYKRVLKGTIVGRGCTHAIPEVFGIAPMEKTA